MHMLLPNVIWVIQLYTADTTDLSLNKVWKPSYLQLQYELLNMQRVHLMSSILVFSYTLPCLLESQNLSVRSISKVCSSLVTGRFFVVWLVYCQGGKIEKKIPCIREKEFHSGDFQSGISTCACPRMNLVIWECFAVSSSQLSSKALQWAAWLLWTLLKFPV